MIIDSLLVYIDFDVMVENFLFVLLSSAKTERKLSAATQNIRRLEVYLSGEMVN